MVNSVETNNLILINFRKSIIEINNLRTTFFTEQYLDMNKLLQMFIVQYIYYSNFNFKYMLVTEICLMDEIINNNEGKIYYKRQR